MQIVSQAVNAKTYSICGLTEHEMLVLSNALYLMPQTNDVCLDTENSLTGESQREVAHRIYTSINRNR